MWSDIVLSQAHLFTNGCLVGQKLVAKPDQMIKRRGKLGLIKVGTDFAGAKAWIQEKMAVNTEVRH